MSRFNALNGQNYYKFGFGVISVINFPDDIVRKGSNLLSGAYLCDIIDVRETAEYPYFEDVSQKPALERRHTR